MHICHGSYAGVRHAREVKNSQRLKCSELCFLGWAESGLCFASALLTLKRSRYAIYTSIYIYILFAVLHHPVHATNCGSLGLMAPLPPHASYLIPIPLSIHPQNNRRGSQGYVQGRLWQLQSPPLKAAPSIWAARSGEQGLRKAQSWRWGCVRRFLEKLHEGYFGKERL